MIGQTRVFSNQGQLQEVTRVGGGPGCLSIGPGPLATRTHTAIYRTGGSLDSHTQKGTVDSHGVSSNWPMTI